MTAADKTKVYGAANPKLTGSIDGIQNGDPITAGFSTEADEKSGVGGYVITAKALGTDAVLANYDVTWSTARLRVTKAKLTSPRTTRPKVYGAGNPALTGTIVGLQNGDEITASYSTVATAGSKVGDYAIVPAAVDSEAKDLANYTVTLVNGSLSITKAELTITAADKTKVYGDANPALTGEIVGLQNGDEITASYSTVATAGSKVGDYAIVPAAVDSEAKDLANYTVTLVNGSLSITKAALTITADDKTKVYGDANPALTGDGGLQNGDVLTRQLHHRRDKGSKVGDYAIVRRRRPVRTWATTGHAGRRHAEHHQGPADGDRGRQDRRSTATRTRR